MEIMVIDNCDSFTFNLCQLIGELGAELTVLNSDTSYEKIMKTHCDRIVLPPGLLDDSGACMYVLAKIGPRIPALGVCLGHQAICAAFGEKVIRAQHLIHGKTFKIGHDGRSIYKGIKNPSTATRYHPLVVDYKTIPDELVISATGLDDGYVMGVRHRHYPIEGIQFHPESILCEEGGEIIRNFLYRGGEAI
jgi:anthranilate synthase/aminodeoxychorismate synthase-like glutamine amidotransferase